LINTERMLVITSVLPWQHDNFNCYYISLQHAPTVHISEMHCYTLISTVKSNNLSTTFDVFLHFASFDFNVKFNLNRFIKCFEMCIFITKIFPDKLFSLINKTK
jgi:hypothetical protein